MLIPLPASSSAIRTQRWGEVQPQRPARDGVREHGEARAAGQLQQRDSPDAHEPPAWAQLHSQPLLPARPRTPPLSFGLRVRVEIVGPGKNEDVGKSQSVLVMIHPMISTRTRTTSTETPIA
jgi:hypothetical protein